MIRIVITNILQVVKEKSVPTVLKSSELNQFCMHKFVNQS